MKTFVFKYDPHPVKTSMEGIKVSIKTGKKDIRDSELLFGNSAALFKLVTKSRLDIFTKIVEHRPESITELARICGKDLGNVQRDTSILESLGLIKLERHPGKRRERIKPVPLYDRVLFEYAPKPLRAVGE